MGTIVKKYIKFRPDKYTDHIVNAFDLQVPDRKIEVSIPMPDIDMGGEWNVGLIVGNSGSGKSTILEELGHNPNYHVEWSNTKPICSNFSPMSPEDVADLFSSIGLASVPNWLKPHRVLSNGEKHRVHLAKIISAPFDQPIFMDEYTSVLSRDVAKAMSNSVQKYIRKNDKKIVLASCHYDIIKWLQPDWVYDAQTGKLVKKKVQTRPQIDLTIIRCHYSAWELFSPYHYLTDKLNNSATCFMALWNGNPVAINCVLNYPSGSVKNAVRGSRLVVLPDYQGLGIGCKLSDYVASLYKHYGYRYYTKTIHPASGNYREKSPNWKGTSKNRKFRSDMRDRAYRYGNMKPLKRASFCHEYIGDPDNGEGLKLLDRIIDKLKKENST